MSASRDSALKRFRLSRSSRRIVWRVAGGLLAIIAALGLAFMIIVQCSRRDFKSPDTSGWRTGDIFFSAGNSWRSIIVKWFGGESSEGTTHCGFVLMVNGRPMLVHMSTDKNEITMESIEDYARLNDVSAISARRLIHMPDTVKLRQDLMKLIAEHKAFDNSFDHDDTTHYYCTELVIRELEHLGHRELTPLLQQEYVYPVDIETSCHVVPVK